jgi:DNA-binding transcriptional ArsR family regulator
VAHEHLREFLLAEVDAHPRDLVRLAVARFGISRQAVHGHLNRLLGDGLLHAAGRTQARRYRVAVVAEHHDTLDRASMQRADEAWRERFAPALDGLRANVLEIARFGFTEVVRNVLEHSGAPSLSARVRRTAASIEIRIADRGSGIFRHLEQESRVDEALEAALAIVKGNRRGLATVARAFDSLLVAAGNQLLHREERDGRESWRLEAIGARVTGTTVGMRISAQSQRTLVGI